MSKMDQMTLALTLRQANSMEVFADGEFWRMYGDLKLVRVDSPKEPLCGARKGSDVITEAKGPRSGPA